MRPRLCGLYCAAKVGIVALIIVNCVLLLVNDIYVFNRAVLEARITLMSDELGKLERTTTKVALQERSVPDGRPIERPKGQETGNLFRSWNPFPVVNKLYALPAMNRINQKPVAIKPNFAPARPGLAVNMQRASKPVNDRFMRNFSTVENVSLCDGKISLFDNAFVRLWNVTLDTQFVAGPTGGEPLESVPNRPETEEYLQLMSGAFRVGCSQASVDKLRTTFGAKNSLSKYVQALSIDQLEHTGREERRVTLVLTRFEYVNLCHSVTYFYNAFLMSRFFQLPASAIDILLADAHPAGGLDDVWSVLFGNTMRIGALPRNSSTLFTDMIWMLQGYDSPLLEHRAQTSPPLLEQFRQFVLQSYAIATNGTADCSKLKVTVILRRDYVAHPRNPTGKIIRKISNEQQLLDGLKSHQSLKDRIVVTAVQLETMNLSEQLRIAANTDVLLGMHGAGLAHVLFLPQHGALVELFPRFFPASARFPAFARWRKMHYLMWKNERITARTRDQELESSIVDVQEVAKRVATAVQKICP